MCVGRVALLKPGAAILEAANEDIAKLLEALLKLVRALSVPGELISGDGIVAGEANVQNVLAVVAAVAVDVVAAKAARGERDGRLADERVAVVAVSVAPDAVDELVVADDGHDAQGLDAVAARVVLDVVGVVALVAKDDVVVDEGVEVLDAELLHVLLEGRLVLRVVGAAAAAVVLGRIGDAVAVNVHVGEVAALALDVDDVVVVLVVAAVAVA